MTNQEFTDHIKDSHTRSRTAIDDIRQALTHIGIRTSAYKSRIDPQSAAWLLYATCAAPSTRKTAAEFVVTAAAQFAAKADRGEVTPIDILTSLFRESGSAAIVERVVIDKQTGDLYAFARGVQEPERALYALEDAPQDQPAIRQLVQVDGDYFRAYHNWNARQN